MKNKVIWLTGLPSAGKTTIAKCLEMYCESKGHPCIILDGDDIRRVLSKDLGFSMKDRRENARRIAAVADLVYRNGGTALVACISPLREYRVLARTLCQSADVNCDFVEVFVDAPIAVCKERDPKKLWGNAPCKMTGIDSPYEAPTHPDIHLETVHLTPNQCVEKISKRVGWTRG